MPHAAIYARVSTAEQAEGHSIDAQLEQLRDYARDHSYAVYGEYVDPGFQGDTDERPALRRLLADAHDQRFEAVFVYRFDRLFREVRLFLNTEHELRQHGVRLVSITEAIDETHEGRLQLVIRGSFAEYEKAVIRERANLGRMRAAKEGKWMGGPPPYGYDLDSQTSRLVINEAEARWVRLFFGWLVKEHLSLQAVQRRVNDHGIPTKWQNLRREKDRPVNRKTWWMKRTLGRILTRELYTGTYYYRRVAKPRGAKRSSAKTRPEEEWIPIRVPAIVDGRLFQLAQIQLRKNAELSPRRTGRPYLLRRLLECGTCGRAWVATQNNFGRAYYICSGRRGYVTSNPCTRPSVSSARIEPVVWDSLVALLHDPQLVLERAARRLAQDGGLEKKKRELQRVARLIGRAEGESARLIRAYKAGVIALNTLSREQSETEERLGRLQRQREKVTGELSGRSSNEAQAAAVAELAGQVVDVLRTLPYERRAEVVRELVERVIVREAAVEIHTVVPGVLPGGASGAAVALRDQPGVDRPAKQHVATCQPGKPARPDRGGDQPAAPRPLIPFFDRAQAIRITLVAEIPPSHNHRRQATRPKAA